MSWPCDAYDTWGVCVSLNHCSVALSCGVRSPAVPVGAVAGRTVRVARVWLGRGVASAGAIDACHRRRGRWLAACPCVCDGSWDEASSRTQRGVGDCDGVCRVTVGRSCGPESRAPPSWTSSCSSCRQLRRPSPCTPVSLPCCRQQTRLRFPSRRCCRGSSCREQR